MVAMTTTEFPIGLNNEAEGLGKLIVTDARLLVRPAVPGQYHRHDRHDTGNAYNVLCLGNDMGEESTHIVFSGTPEEAHKILDRVFHCFVDSCCLQLGCEARVYYFIDGETVDLHEYGWEDGSYAMTLYVHCNVPEEETDAFVDSLIREAEPKQRFVVVRPDSSERGYAACGFTVDQSSEDDIDDEPYDERDEEEWECSGGCGQPDYACTCDEMDSFRRFQSDPATAGSSWTP